MEEASVKKMKSPQHVSLRENVLLVAAMTRPIDDHRQTTCATPTITVLRALLLPAVVACWPLFAPAQILTMVDSIRLNHADIWGVTFDGGDSLGITTTQFTNGKAHIYLRKIDYGALNQQSPLKPLTFDSDFTNINRLTDHATLMLHNHLYVAFSTVGDQDLFLFKTDRNGNRIGGIVTVVSGSSDPTNDMMVTTDSTYVYVLHYSPPFHHHVYQFDTTLTPITASTTTTHNHNNIGQAVFYDHTFHLFTGDGFGLHAGVILTEWDTHWNAVGSPQMLLPPQNGDGNWFSTGAVYDAVNHRWYVAFSHIESGQSLGQEHIDLAVFDADFRLLERHHVTPPGYFRPHLTLKNGFLYLAYDAPGTGVFLVKYRVRAAASAVGRLPQERPVEVYPNPASDKIYFSVPQGAPVKAVEIYTLFGRLVYSQNNLRPISLSTLQSGTYLIRMIDRRGHTYSLNSIRIEKS